MTLYHTLFTLESSWALCMNFSWQCNNFFVGTTIFISSYVFSYTFQHCPPYVSHAGNISKTNEESTSNDKFCVFVAILFGVLQIMVLTLILFLCLLWLCLCLFLSDDSVPYNSTEKMNRRKFGNYRSILYTFIHLQSLTFSKIAVI
jgi:hypothetical protein